MFTVSVYSYWDVQHHILDVFCIIPIFVFDSIFSLYIQYNISRHVGVVSNVVFLAIHIVDRFLSRLTNPESTYFCPVPRLSRTKLAQYTVAAFRVR